MNLQVFKSIPELLLLVGPSAVSGSFAKQVATQMLPEKTGHSIDLQEYYPDTKTQQYQISTVHQMIQEAGLPPMSHNKKVLIIHEADQLSPVCVNALLKTLESTELPVHWIFLTENLSSLLPTFTSRCVVHFFCERESFSLVDENIKQLASTLCCAFLSHQSINPDLVKDYSKDERKQLLRILLGLFRDCILYSCGGERSLLFFPENIQLYDSLKSVKFNFHEVCALIDGMAQGDDIGLSLKDGLIGLQCAFLRF